MNNELRPRRLLASGGSRLSKNAASLWRLLGRLLALENGLVVITGGSARREENPSEMTADSIFLNQTYVRVSERALCL